MNTYLDWAATSVPDKEIITKTAETALKIYGNPLRSMKKVLKQRIYLKIREKSVQDRFLYL